MNNGIIDSPEWFRRAVQIIPQDREVFVEGCRIHYCVWPDSQDVAGDKPGLLFVHGSGAHAHWWDFIAPYFLQHHRVAAIDLSGMGDSGHRKGYTSELFAREVVAVCQHAGFDRNAVLVGHSFGGFVTAKAALIAEGRVSGVVLVDSPVRPPDYDWEHDPRKSPIQPKKIYPELDLALSRFRLVPGQPCENKYILDYIARRSLMEVEGGWSWKFDDRLFVGFKIGNTSADLSNLSCRVGVIYGDNSILVSQEVVDYMFKVLDRSVPFIAIPEANHHLFLDQPLAFIAALRAVLAEWRHSRPERGTRSV